MAENATIRDWLGQDRTGRSSGVSRQSQKNVDGAFAVVFSDCNHTALLPLAPNRLHVAEDPRARGACG